MISSGAVENCPLLVENFFVHPIRIILTSQFTSLLCVLCIVKKRSAEKQGCGSLDLWKLQLFIEVEAQFPENLFQYCISHLNTLCNAF